MARNGRKYSDDERSAALLALAANGGNVKRTAEELDIPEPTLRYWKNGNVHSSVVKDCEEKKAPLADRLELMAHNLVGDLDADGERKTASYRDKSRTLGIIIDKMQLLRGKPTSITALDLGTLTDDDLDREITTLQGCAGTPLPAPAREAEAGSNGIAR